MVQSKDGRDTAKNRIGQPGLSLIGNGSDSFMAAIDRNILQEFGHIASAEHLVDCSKASHTLVRTKVGCEDAPIHALSS